MLGGGDNLGKNVHGERGLAPKCATVGVIAEVRGEGFALAVQHREWED